MIQPTIAIKPNVDVTSDIKLYLTSPQNFNFCSFAEDSYVAKHIAARLYIEQMGAMVDMTNDGYDGLDRSTASSLSKHLHEVTIGVSISMIEEVLDKLRENIINTLKTMQLKTTRIDIALRETPADNIITRVEGELVFDDKAASDLALADIK